MTVTTWMWEAKAAPGRAAELAHWARSVLRGRVAEIYRGRGASEGLVVALVHLRGDGSGPPGGDHAPLPDPPDGLLAGAAHAWQFERVDIGLDRSDRLG